MSTAASTGDTQRTHRASRDAFRVRLGDNVYRIDSSTTDVIEETDDNPRAYKNTPTEGKLPSFGEKYDSCGDKMIHFCGDCGRIARNDEGDPAEIGMTCWRRECPRCADGGAMRQSYNPTAKMESMRRQANHERDENEKSPRFHHVAITFPSLATAGKDPDEAAWELAKTVLDETAKGYYGALLVHHSYSGKNGDDRDAWKKRLFNDRSWEDVEGELKTRHHVHAIVVADRVEHLLCESVADRTDNGIVTHRVENRDGNSVSLYNQQDLAGAVTYALSHARTDDDADAYRYCGRLANHSAGHQVKAQMKEVVRSVAPQTLGLSLGDTTCGHNTEDEDVNALRPQFDSAGGGGGGGSDTSDEDSSSTPECGGRLVPIEHAPSFIDEVTYSDTLREEYNKWNGAPPPD